MLLCFPSFVFSRNLSKCLKYHEQFFFSLKKTQKSKQSKKNRKQSQNVQNLKKSHKIQKKNNLISFFAEVFNF